MDFTSQIVEYGLKIIGILIGIGAVYFVGSKSGKQQQVSEELKENEESYTDSKKRAESIVVADRAEFAKRMRDAEQ